MKKIGIVLLSLILLGCQGAPSQKKENLVWDGTYLKDNIDVVISMEDDFPDGFKFDFQYNGDDMTDYATYEDEEKLHAICSVTEDGYTLRFTLEKDKVIIEEIDGHSYLDIGLSGEYIKK